MITVIVHDANTPTLPSTTDFARVLVEQAGYYDEEKIGLNKICNTWQKNYGYKKKKKPLSVQDMNEINNLYHKYGRCFQQDLADMYGVSLYIIRKVLKHGRKDNNGTSQKDN